VSQASDVDNAPVDVASAPVPVPVDTAPQAEPPQPKAKQPKKSKGQAPAESEDLKMQLDTLNAQLTETRRLLESEQSQRIEIEAQAQKAKEEARTAWLEKAGIKNPDYMALAPTLEAGADAMTEQGKALLARWRSEHPELFAGAPSPPKVDHADRPSLLGGTTWASFFKSRLEG